MYVRQFGYKIVPSQEVKAVALCRQFADALCERGFRARVVVDRPTDATLLIVEEHLSLSSMVAAQQALECDENFRSALCAWASEFYPLVQASMPAVVMREQKAA